MGTGTVESTSHSTRTQVSCIFVDRLGPFLPSQVDVYMAGCSSVKITGSIGAVARDWHEKEQDGIRSEDSIIHT